MAVLGSHVTKTVMPFLPNDKDRVYSLMKGYISDRNAMLLVSKNNGVIQGGALAITANNPYAKKMNTQLIGLYTDITGDGIEMFSRINNWFESRANSLILCYAAPADTRLDKLLHLKFNLQRQGTMLVRRRYNGIS